MITRIDWITFLLVEINMLLLLWVYWRLNDFNFATTKEEIMEHEELERMAEQRKRVYRGDDPCPLHECIHCGEQWETNSKRRAMRMHPSRLGKHEDTSVAPMGHVFTPLNPGSNQDVCRWCKKPKKAHEVLA